MESKRTYFAFISYKREDEQWAAWLQHKLEHYRLPSNLNGRTDLPREIRPVFRDTSELAPGNLPRQISEALEQSRYLIVVCSPRSARSEWVNREVETFIALGRTDCIIPFIVDGTARAGDPERECFPPALRALPAEQELLGAGIDEMGREAAAVKVVARMFGLRFDMLWQRYERDRRKRRRIVVAGLLALLLSAGGVACWMWQKNGELARQNEVILRAKLSLAIALAANHLYRGHPEMAIVALEDPNRRSGALDSLARARRDALWQAIADSLSVRPVRLASVTGTVPPPDKPGLDALIARYPMFRYGEEDEYGTRPLCLSRHVGDTVLCDTLWSWYPNLIHIAANREQTHVALFNDGDYGYQREADMDEARWKGGIRVYSLATEELTGFVGCGGYFAYLAYPIALSSKADKLLYREGWRENDWLWLADFGRRTRTCIHSWAGADMERSAFDFADGAFSPDDSHYYLHYERDNRIEVFRTEELRPVYTFAYEQCDTLYWGGSNRLCVRAGGCTYAWDILRESLVRQFHAGASLVVSVALSPDGELAAAACADGRVIVWNLSAGEPLWHGYVVESPADIAFAPDGQSLWAVSGFNELKAVDIASGQVQTVAPKPTGDNSAPHAYYACLRFSADGRYCLSFFAYGSRYAAYDVRTRQRAADIGEEVLHFPLPDDGIDLGMANLESSEAVLVAEKLSDDGTVAIEGYSDGTVKIRPAMPLPELPGLEGNVR